MSKLEKLLLAGLVIIVVLFGKSLIAGDSYQGQIMDPVQVDMAKPETIALAGEAGEIPATLLAAYTLEGVVKSKKKYSDFPAQISKYDLAFAWGDLNQEDVDAHVKYSQSGRWYYFRYDGDSPVDVTYIENHSANVHMVHKDRLVLAEIKKIDEGDHVRLTGYLVNVNFAEGPWKTSLTRTDTGGGSCEIMYVTDVEQLGD